MRADTRLALTQKRAPGLFPKPPLLKGPSELHRCIESPKEKLSVALMLPVGRSCPVPAGRVLPKARQLVEGQDQDCLQADSQPSTPVPHVWCRAIWGVLVPH